MPILESPVDLTKHPITLAFWTSESSDPALKGFYNLFDGHHSGIDFDLPKGTAIQAALSGIVVRREFNPGMGNTLAIRLGSIYVLYAHLKDFCVDLAQIIHPKQLIAYSGNTGSATTGPHLHFELRDLSEKELKNSVFEPVFGQDLKNFQPTFNYVVNNTNSQKTFVSLAVSYFGLPTYAPLIRDHNSNLKDISLDSPLPQDQTIIIPPAPLSSPT